MGANTHSTDTPEVPPVPAAFINAIAEEGTKAEAVEWLQKTWNERCQFERKLAEARMEAEGRKESEEFAVRELNRLLVRAEKAESALSARSETAPTSGYDEQDTLAPIADCIASAHRNSNMPNPEFGPLTLDSVRQQIWQLSYEVNRLRGATPDPAATAPTRSYEDGLEDAAKECLKIWREADNEPNADIRLSYRQDSIWHGCIASAEAIRALKVKP